MKQHTGHKSVFKKLLRDEGGAVLLIFTVYLPVVVGFFSLAVDMSYVYRTRNTLQVTAEAAALAAASFLPDTNAACLNAKAYATANMAPGSYGNVLKQNTTNCSDVVVGMWTCPDGQTCSASHFVPATTTACGIQCNAVKVITRMSAANSNSLPLAFASMIGIPTFDVTATAIAVYGNDPAATPWNISLVQDVSGSFADEITSAKAAAQALETCMFNNASSGSKMGIGLFGLTSSNYQSPLAVGSNNSALTTAISNINVGGNGMPSSGGTDIAAGMNTAINQICPGTTCSPPPTTFKPAMVILTDGMPTAVNGSYCGNSNSCLNTAKQNAVNAANAAADKGMDVYAIYFCSDGNCNSTTNTNAANWMAGLVKGNGKFTKTPTAAQMAELMVTSVCKPSHKMRLVW